MKLKSDKPLRTIYSTPAVLAAPNPASRDHGSNGKHKQKPSATQWYYNPISDDVSSMPGRSESRVNGGSVVVMQQLEGKVMTSELAAAVTAQSDRVIVSMMVPNNNNAGQQPQQQQQRQLTGVGQQQKTAAVAAVEKTVQQQKTSDAHPPRMRKQQLLSNSSLSDIDEAIIEVSFDDIYYVAS
jgi:hypothetical protein